MEWGDFKIGDLFEINTYKKRFDANKVKIFESGDFPYVVRTGLNNGIKGYIIEDEQFLNEVGIKVTIFLSVFDVHINRSPIAGEIKFQQYTCGRFRPAYKESVGCENERHSIGIENENMRVLVTQIAGLLARRIVSWVTLGNVLTKGERYGLIKFASCTEIIVPKTVEILVKKGDRVTGGSTVIGRVLP